MAVSQQAREAERGSFIHLFISLFIGGIKMLYSGALRPAQQHAYYFHLTPYKERDNTLLYK